jgi:acetyl-CoA C-acetyltransferase
MARLNETAALNPHAWFRTARSAEDLAMATPGNRMVALPYTKHMTAFPDVDMAAANLLVTRAVADRWNIPEGRRVYLRGWGFARDSVHIGARADLASSPAMRASTSEALAMAGLDAAQVDVFDFYSCFGSAVQFAQDALRLAPDDPRPITLTGGLPYHGGPSSNFMGHSISHVVEHLRSSPDEVGLVTGVGMHMTKHVAAVWSTTPGDLHHPGRRHGTQQWEAPPLVPDVTIVDRADGPATALAATVVHRSDGSASHAVAICERPDGTRCYARSEHPDALEVVATGAWIGEKAHVAPGAAGRNEIRW